MTEGNDLGLAAAINAVREELSVAQASGDAGDVRFGVGEVEVQLTVEMTKTGGGEASIKVLNLFSVGGSGSLEKGDINRITVKLTPVDEHGEPFEVASIQRGRPDGD